MRELKFRCWGIKENKYLKLHSIHLSTSKVIVSYCGVGGGNISKALKDVVLEQDTGLKDKNGKEIYENDVVKCYSQDTYPIGKVIYSEEWAGYEIVAYDAEQRVYSLEHFSPIISEYLEVIGTIHENPELLGGEE